MKEDTKNFGFLVYVMTDLIIFAALFATFLVLRTSTFGGPSGKELFDISLAFKETLILLTSSFACSLAMLSIHQKKKKLATFWLLLTLMLGFSFLHLELSEFSKLIESGNSWQRSAFLSSFFTLVGTHGLHISIGLLWMIVELFRIWLKPLHHENISKLSRMALYWHFLDFVWIFIFTVVYGMGHLA